MIKVDNLSVSYGNGMSDIISDMSFNLEQGCILNILGQNAVGKTTLIRTIMRELPDYRGSVNVDGKEIQNYSIQEYAKITGVVSTSSITFQNLLVADYLITGFLNQMNPFTRSVNDCVQKAYEVLRSFGKQELFNKHINQLSSGEKQLIMIARVLLQNPKVIIFDEPTANLDVKNQIFVLDQIKKLSVRGYTILVTTHNPGHAYSMGGKTLMMGKGQYCFGDTQDVISQETLSKYYDLNVTMRKVDEFPCMVFKSNTNLNGVQVIF